MVPLEYEKTIGQQLWPAAKIVLGATHTHEVRGKKLLRSLVTTGGEPAPELTSATQIEQSWPVQANLLPSEEKLMLWIQAPRHLIIYHLIVALKIKAGKTLVCF